MPASPRWPTSRGCASRRAPIIWASCWARASTPAAASARPISARGCCRATITHEVGALALRLDEFNAERRAIEREVLDQAIARIEGLYGPDRKGLPAALIVESEGWHVGVIGIVASRLVERYGRPAFVIGMDGDLGKGSGRSVRGVDLGAAVLAARQSGLLVNGGGHAMAAGLTVARSALADLAQFLDERIAPQLGAAPPVRELGIDAALAPGAATQELVAMIERAGPFGAGNALPRFALTSVRVNYAQPVGEGHVRCTLVGAARPGRGDRLPRRPDRARARAARSARGRSCMSQAPCASTATMAARPCACRSTTPRRPRARSCADSASLISAAAAPTCSRSRSRPLRLEA